MNANWYDLLDVDPTATAEDIRAAWKAAIDGMDPTDRKFRVFSQAAAVLLDPDRRAAYDVRLALEESETEVDTKPEPEPPISLAKEYVLAEGLPTGSTAENTSTATGVGRRPVPAWLLIGLALLTALVGVGALAMWSFRPSDQAIADATAEAEAAAQRAVPAIFSYDYRRLVADHDAAAGFMTADYRKRYDPLFEVVKENAPGLRAVTNASFIASGVVRTGNGREADDRVQVFVIFDQLTTNKARTSPSRTPAFATLTMEREGDNWLVDDVQGPPVLE